MSFKRHLNGDFFLKNCKNRPSKRVKLEGYKQMYAAQVIKVTPQAQLLYSDNLAPQAPKPNCAVCASARANVTI